MHAELKRAFFPLTTQGRVATKHRTAALVSTACRAAFWPLAFACAAIDGYREAQKAVLRVLP